MSQVRAGAASGNLRKPLAASAERKPAVRQTPISRSPRDPEGARPKGAG